MIDKMEGTFIPKSIGKQAKYRVGGVVLLVAILLSSISIAFAYVPIEKYKGINMKFYISIDKEVCYDIIDSIPLEYFDGVSFIRVTKESIRHGGFYYWGSTGIDLYGKCSKNVLIHELAHHCQEEEGDYLWEGIAHTWNFEKCEAEIWKSSIE